MAGVDYLVCLFVQEASYTHPSEARQNKNHKRRKLTKLITWVTAMSNAMTI